MTEREEIIRERVNDLVMTLFDAADMITSVEDDGAGDLEEVFEEIKRQVSNINNSLNRYLGELEEPDEDEDEDEEDEDEDEE